MRTRTESNIEPGKFTMTVRATIKLVMRKRRNMKIRSQERRHARMIRKRIRKYLGSDSAIDDLFSTENSKNVRTL